MAYINGRALQDASPSAALRGELQRLNTAAQEAADLAHEIVIRDPACPYAIALLVTISDLVGQTDRVLRGL